MSVLLDEDDTSRFATRQPDHDRWMASLRRCEARDQFDGIVQAALWCRLPDVRYRMLVDAIKFYDGVITETETILAADHGPQ